MLLQVQAPLQGSAQHRCPALPPPLGSTVSARCRPRPTGSPPLRPSTPMASTPTQVQPSWSSAAALGAGGACLACVGCSRGAPHPRNTLDEPAMCSHGITAGRREFRQGAALALPGSTWPGALSCGSCTCIRGFLWLILSSFSFLFSSQLKAPRWQTPSSRPTPACSTMQVSNFASHSFPLSPLCSSPLFLGGEYHHGVEHWTGAAYLGRDS